MIEEVIRYPIYLASAFKLLLEQNLLSHLKAN